MLESAQNKLYDPRLEHDACGIGAVVSLRGIKTHQTVDNALKIVEKLEHRAGKDAAGETGDGVGLMIQIPHKLMVKAARRRGHHSGGSTGLRRGILFFPTARPQAGPGQEDAGNHRSQGGHGISGLAGRSHPPGGPGGKGSGVHAPHLPVLCQAPGGLRQGTGI